jgi:hypothetical protein
LEARLSGPLGTFSEISLKYVRGVGIARMEINIRKICPFFDLKAFLKNVPFAPLESPAACCGDEDKIAFEANTGFKAPCELSR